MKIAKKIGLLFIKIFKWFVTGLVLFVLLLLSGLNVAKHFIYFDYYNSKQNVCRVPDLNNGFVPQGLGYSETENLILQSGYFAGSNYCVIYLIDEDGNSKKLNIVNEDGTMYEGHFGGIACYKDFVYVSEDYVSGDYDVSNRLYVFSLQDLLDKGNDENVVLPSYINVDTEGATVSYNDVYVGEYYAKGSYETLPSHEIITPSGERQNALVCAYPIDEDKEFGLGELEYQISIPSKMQGFAVKDGVCVTSTSWGPLSSTMGFYSLEKSNNTQDSSGKEVPLYYIDESTLIKKISLPAMSEGVFIKDNRVHVYFESAGNKYIFGKFFNAYYVTSVPMVNK